MSAPIPPSPADVPPTRRELLLLAATVTVLVVATYLTEPSLWGTIDWVRIHGFYKAYGAEALQAGRLPLWNPHIALGRPFLADVDAALFYPPHLLYVALPVKAAAAVVLGMHLFLGGYGTMRLARALGAMPAPSFALAVVFLSSAPIVGSFASGLVHYGGALCYLPLVLYLCTRLQTRPSLRVVAALALLLGLQLMGGHPQATWLTGFGAVAFLVGRRVERPLGAALKGLGLDLACFAGAAAWAAVFAAVTLLPLTELTGQSNRQAASLAFAGSFAMAPYAWATLVVPTDARFSFLSNAQLYVGLAPLVAGVAGLLTVRGRDARAIVLLMVLGALVAAGTATPAFAVMYHLVPGLSMLRIPSRASVLVALALVMGAALFLSARPSRRSRLAVVAVGAVATTAAALFVALWPAFDGGRGARLAARLGLALGAIALLLLWQWRSSPRVLALLAALTVVDLAAAAWGLKHQNRDEPVRPAEPLIAGALRDAGQLRPGAPPPRVSIPKPWARENAGMAEGWSSFTGYAALMLGRVWTYLHASLDLPVPLEQNTYPDGPIFRRGPFPYDTMGLVLGFDPVARRPVLNRAPDPRAFLTHAALQVDDWRQALTRLRAGHDARRVTLLESAPPAGLPRQAPEALAGRAIIERFEPERITVRVESPAPALLVLAEAWYPGWGATVNGVTAPVLPANVWQRAVPVPAGTSTVVLEFRSRFLLPGAALSLLAAAAALAALGRRRRERRPVPLAPARDNPTPQSSTDRTARSAQENEIRSCSRRTRGPSSSLRRAS